MKKVYQALLAALILWIGIILSFSASATDPQILYYAIPSSAAYNDHLSILPGTDGDFYLLSSDDTQTQLSLFDAIQGEFRPLHTEPLPYTAALLSPGTLVIASSTMQYDETEQAFLCSTRMTYYEKNTGIFESYVFPDLYLENSRCLAVDAYGFFYTVDRESPSIVRIFNRSGVLQHTIPCNDRISSVTASPSGEQIYITYTDNRRFSRLDCSLPDAFGQPVDLDMDSPELPYRFLDDTSYMDAAGDRYVWEENRFRLSYSSLCPQPSPCLYQNFLLCFPKGGPLLYLDQETGEAVAQSPDIEGTPVDFSVSGDTGAILLSFADGYRIACVDLNHPETLQPTIVSPSYCPLNADQIALLWKENLPVNLSTQQVYTQPADLEHFAYPAALSQQVLEDGLRAVNFYRSLYGLSPVVLDTEGCQSLAYGAVLSLWETTDGDVPDKPEDMPDSFYGSGLQAYQSGVALRQDTLSPYPVAQAVHTLIKENPSFRESLLSPDLASVSFGAATAEDGSTAVMLSSHTEQPGMMAYPSGGAFPQGLAASTIWSLSLDNSLLCGVRGTPTVTITDLDTGVSSTLTWEDGLSPTQNGLEWDPPSPIPSRFTVQVHNLCTKDGMPAMVEYSGSLFSMDLSLPEPEDPSGSLDPDKISSSQYIIDREQGWIYGISPSTSSAAFRGNLTAEGELVLFRDNRPVTSGNAGTGMAIQLLQDGTVVDELTLVIYGDVSGEGNVNTLDFRTLRDHLLEKESLNGPFLQAADVNHDGQVNTLDLLALDKFLAGSYDILQK